MATTRIDIERDVDAVVVRGADDWVEYEVDYPRALTADQRLTAYLKNDTENYWKELLSHGPPPEHYGWSFSRSWKTIGSSRRLLSLATMNQEYTGGAHSNHYYISLIWDREEHRPVRFEQLFTSKRRAISALTSAYRSAAREYGEDTPFFDKYPIALVGKAGSDITGIRFLFHDFNEPSLYAAEYLQLDKSRLYDHLPGLTLPVTPEFLRHIKPEYGSEFAPQTQ